MKVRITHSIELEEIPERAAELLEPAGDKLADAVRWLDNLSRDLYRSNVSAEVAAGMLDRIRRAMGEADAVLSEVEGIMQGVADYEKQEALLSTSPTTEQPTGDFDQMVGELMEEKAEQNRLLAEDMLRGLKEKQDENLPI